ncbi:peptidylprolyl isomerase [Acidocella aminolytica]|uniref:Parvulin-like PPIase n=1 Tax=Acidocella aminolytica 101 = DSM 11237 TaxID=1120923 RepID=A0A0D6PBY1_9PROT|nr:peptidylprolyl isomerase [Acidocella aminolytica]GAN78871.1 peptidyl-prolyl cis-trans isomerase [Acidocella aminolytica 101 = DSM 11237]GBQ34464.1 peptidyl-prolyl cis-trans isomerase [Acidocella aminolytica 101 = DSM 11237]SHF16657.1 peptidyl-prolyl cis-trans isomerase C [Acidocella aminolytica 101 = DSM 11237]
MRHLPTLSALALSLALAAPAAFAATTSSADSSKTAAPADSNPVVATVNNIKIHMSDIQADAQNIPPQMQQLPPEKLLPLLINQEVDRKALLIAAQKEGLEKDPNVAARMKAAANVQLENAYVQKAVAAQVTDTAVQAYYDQHYAGKPGPEQVDARQILVSSKEKAEDIIKQLNKGADFAKLAEKDSIDPGAKNGGELGWFSKDEMVPAFADAAFALKKGEYTKTPVQTQFGWHVILNEGHRTAPTPSLDDVKQEIRQKLADQAVQNVLDKVRGQVKIQVFDANGKPLPEEKSAPSSSDSSK